MATVTTTALFSSLPGWSGDLLAAWNGTVVTTHTATTFSYTIPVGQALAGYSVTISGTGFAYDGGIAVGGTIGRVEITDGTSNTVLLAEGIMPASPASDFALFYSYIFGWVDGFGNTQSPQPNNAWSMLLSGNDTIFGTDGSDNLRFEGLNAGNDEIFGYGGNDNFVGGIGNDTIHGGDGIDWLFFDTTYSFAGGSVTRGIRVDVAAGTVIDSWGYTDKVDGIEYFRGSALRDEFIGGAGGDRFDGGRGADTLDGGAGSDRILYDDDFAHGGTRGITVDLEVTSSLGHIHGTVRDGYGNKDVTIDIEEVIGTKYNDLFIGSSADNVFVGGAGKDSFNGDAGQDTIWFFWGSLDGPVNVDLSLAKGQIRNDGFGNVENVVSIENIVGSTFDDRIKGNAGSNWLEGFDGKDTLTGGGGTDTFVWYNFPDFGDNDIVTDFHAGGGANHDVLRFNMSGWGFDTTLHLVNGTAATSAVGTFIFNAANHVLYFDDDGTGGHAKYAIATLTGVNALTAGNFDLF